MLNKSCRGFVSSFAAASTTERRAGSSIQEFDTCLNTDVLVRSFLEKVGRHGGKAWLRHCLALAEVEEEVQHVGPLATAEGWQQQHKQTAFSSGKHMAEHAP